MLALEQLNHALSNPKIEVMNFLNEVTSRYPNAISFAPGRPREELFDVKASLNLIDTYISYEAQLTGKSEKIIYGQIGQYGRTNGVIGEHISRLLLNDLNIQVNAEDIVVTVGCQEAMCLCLLALCRNPGDVALIADPAYIGISGAARLLGIEVAPVAMDHQGIDLNSLEHTVKKLRSNGKQPRLLYLSPEFANPTGVSLNQNERQALLKITHNLNLVVLEDDAYGYFWYDQAPLGALKSLPDSDHVIYLGSFSKSIYPGLRVGFLVAPQRIKSPQGKNTSLAAYISSIKSLLTVNTSGLNQALVGGLLIKEQHSLKKYVEPRRLAMKENRDVLLTLLQEIFPNSSEAKISWNTPSGGFFLSLKLPFAADDKALLDCIQNYGVIWTPMSYFFLEQENSAEIRLSFSYLTPDQIKKGIEALGQFIKNNTSE